jgi:hypothetical protein
MALSPFNIAHILEEPPPMVIIYLAGKATVSKKLWTLGVILIAIVRKEGYMLRDLRSTTLVHYLNMHLKQWTDVGWKD